MTFQDVRHAGVPDPRPYNIKLLRVNPILRGRGKWFTSPSEKLEPEVSTSVRQMSANLEIIAGHHADNWRTSSGQLADIYFIGINFRGYKLLRG